MQLYPIGYQNPENLPDGLPANSNLTSLLVQHLSFIYSQEFENQFQLCPQAACEKGCDYLSNVLFMLSQELKAKKNYSKFRKELANFSETLKRSFQRLSHPIETEEQASNQEISFQQQNHKMIQKAGPFSRFEKQSTKTNSSNSQFTSFDSGSLLIKSSDSKKSSENEENLDHKTSNHIFENPKSSNIATSLKKEEEEEAKLNLNKTSVQTDPLNSFQKKLNSSSSSYLNSTYRYSQLTYKRENLNRGLRNLGLICYFNSSLQSWYHIEAFRNSVLCAIEVSTPLFGRLQTFFNEMQRDSEYLDDAHERLVHEMFSARDEQFKLYKKGDSGLLFQALIEELSGERDPKTIPYLKIFLGGSLLKTRKCHNCPAEKKIREPIKLLEVRDCDFRKEIVENYFQPSFETRTCTCISGQTVFECSYSAINLPKVLAIRIHDTKNNFERVRLLDEITLQEESTTSIRLLEFVLIRLLDPEKRPKEVKYRFVTGIFNTYKGEDGGHSVEISKHNEKYYEWNDMDLNSYFSIDSIYKNPKVLYYQRV